ncbi:unnamed protein product, partial [Meganyctiphanes norvegica]
VLMISSLLIFSTPSVYSELSLGLGYIYFLIHVAALVITSTFLLMQYLGCSLASHMPHVLVLLPLTLFCLPFVLALSYHNSAYCYLTGTVSSLILSSGLILAHQLGCHSIKGAYIETLLNGILGTSLFCTGGITLFNFTFSSSENDVWMQSPIVSSDIRASALTKGNAAAAATIITAILYLVDAVMMRKTLRTASYYIGIKHH